MQTCHIFLRVLAREKSSWLDFFFCNHPLSRWLHFSIVVCSATSRSGGEETFNEREKQLQKFPKRKKLLPFWICCFFQCELLLLFLVFLEKTYFLAFCLSFSLGILWKKKKTRFSKNFIFINNHVFSLHVSDLNTNWW